MNAGLIITSVYTIGLTAFALCGLFEMALSAIEVRRIDRDDWSRGEPWQQRHNHQHREREQVAARRAGTLVMYSPVWPLLVIIVAWRIAGRLRKGTTTP